MLEQMVVEKCWRRELEEKCRKEILKKRIIEIYTIKISENFEI